jgi:hypothetical protein
MRVLISVMDSAPEAARLQGRIWHTGGKKKQEAMKMAGIATAVNGSYNKMLLPLGG